MTSSLLANVTIKSFNQQRIVSAERLGPLYFPTFQRLSQHTDYADIALRGDRLSRIEATPRRMFSQPFS